MMYQSTPTLETGASLLDRLERSIARLEERRSTFRYYVTDEERDCIPDEEETAYVGHTLEEACDWIQGRISAYGDTFDRYIIAVRNGAFIRCYLLDYPPNARPI